jgi:integrase
MSAKLARGETMHDTSNRSSFQQGTIELLPRPGAPGQWRYRWREYLEDGSSVRRSKIIGDTKRYPTKVAAQRAVTEFRAEINTQEVKAIQMTVAQAWEHFQLHELYDKDVNRSPTTIKNYFESFKNHIIPKWGDTPLDGVKAVQVEGWLRTLMQVEKPRAFGAAPVVGQPLAKGSKAKIRNHMSSLYAHCIRHELYTRINPISAVRQSAARARTPDVLTIEEMFAIMANIDQPAIRMWVGLSAATAFRRSESRGLKWEDLDFKGLWFYPKRGLVGKDLTQMKTETSHNRVEMEEALAESLLAWRSVSPYPQDTDWVFASPFTGGKSPYWPDSALKDHVRPAAIKAGITTKVIGWHTYRRSLATLMSSGGADRKTIQELLRHASGKMTDLYIQGDSKAKRSALSKMSGIFAVPVARQA